MHDLLDLLRRKVDPHKIRKASGSKGGEWHSPCPVCGGNDRFSVFPEQEGGPLCQKHGLRGTWACMRGCQKGGDVLSWYQEIEGMTFSDTCAELGIKAEGGQARRGYQPLRSYPHAPAAFTPRSYAEPCAEWKNAATRLANEAYHRLWDTPAIMRYLEKRGLPQEAVDAYGLGYLEGEGKHPDCVFRARKAFGLPAKTGRDGRAIHAFRIPRGITIPAWGKDQACLRIRIRRRDIDRDKSNPKDPKYLLVPQPDTPYSAPLVLPSANLNPSLAVWVIVEAELDAMAIHHACQGKVGAISILTARGKPDMTAHRLLAASSLILVALDADEDKEDGSNPGAEAWLWWKQTYPQAKLWPVPEGKDPGEAFACGVNLSEWIMAGVPLYRLKNASISLQTEKSGTGFGTMGNNAETVAGVERKETAPEIDFPAMTLPEDVEREHLLESQARRPLGHPDCLVPCPRTKPAFWWRYHRDCKKCKGHPDCLLPVLESQSFLNELEKYRESK